MQKLRITFLNVDGKIVHNESLICHYYDNFIAQCDLQIDQQLYENKFLELIDLTVSCCYFIT
jgi:hypothetical protein